MRYWKIQKWKDMGCCHWMHIRTWTRICYPIIKSRIWYCVGWKKQRETWRSLRINWFWLKHHYLWFRQNSNLWIDWANICKSQMFKHWLVGKQCRHIKLKCIWKQNPWPINRSFQCERQISCFTHKIPPSLTRSKNHLKWNYKCWINSRSLPIP